MILRNARFLVACSLVFGLGLSVTGASPSAGVALPAIKHVFVIVLENESETAAFGSSSPAPYLANTLPAQGAFIPNYYGIGHSSLDNYIAMVSGQAPNPTTQADCKTFSEFPAGPLNADGQVVGNGCVYPTNVPTISGQMDTAGLTWRGYMDSMGADPARETATCGHPTIGTADHTQAATATDQYATRHDPFVYFHSIIDNQAYCDAHVLPISNLATDLGSYASTPNLSFITPSLCNDGHDTPCANGQPGGLTQVNTFLSKTIPMIEASDAYKRDGLIVVTFDESEGDDAASCCGEQSGPNVAQPGGTGPGGGRTGAVLESPFITAGTVTQTAYNHYSLLRSMEDIFGLSHLGYAAPAGLTSFGSDIFAAPGSTTTTTTTTSTTTTTKAPTAPGVPGAFAAHVKGAALVLTWKRLTSGTVAHYRLYRNGVLWKTLAGSAAGVTIANFQPTKPLPLTLRAFNSAGQGSPSTRTVTIVPKPRPVGIPKTLPGWAPKLFAWETKGHVGKRPAPPSPLPHWYAVWKAWRLVPATIH